VCLSTSQPVRGINSPSPVEFENYYSYVHLMTKVIRNIFTWGDSMKKVVSVLSVCLLFIGCASNMVVTDNPYTHETDLKYENTHKVIEGKLDNKKACYSRHIKNGKKTPIVLELGLYAMADPMPGVKNIYTGYNGEDLDETAYVLINETSFPVKLMDRQNNKNRSYHGYEQGYGYAYGSQGTYTGTVSIGGYTQCQLAAKIVFTPEMEKALAGAEKMTIRMTTGGIPTILKASSGQLEKIKELINYQK